MIADLNLTPWPLWKKILFRFFFIYLMLSITPWTWLAGLPGLSTLIGFYHKGLDWVVYTSNTHIFKMWDTLVPLNGSGDTSYGWTLIMVHLTLAVIGCIVWSLIDYKRVSYDVADYWLRTFVRYFISMQCLGYGIIKIFALQMVFPSVSQLATPLGDLLPMRFSWLFIGYSSQYQIFSGVMETLAGLLLLNRKTVTLGLLMATGVFANVVLLNLSYDIPVKIFSMHILFYCIYLLAYDFRRLTAFFILNQPVGPHVTYHVTFPFRWSKLTRLGLKVAFVIMIVILPFYNSYSRYQSIGQVKELKPIKPGLYDVKTFVVNGDTIPPLLSDSLRWKDVVFEKDGSGSVNSVDTIFRQRYRRGYFIYKPDTTTSKISFKKRLVTNAEVSLFEMWYKIPGEKTIQLSGKIGKDSVYVELEKSKRRFQLAERQFHWLSEYNR